jgi:outer membrane biogenesis lipoprotein LolB
MKLRAGFMLLLISVLLAACETTTIPPDATSVQPSQDQVNQEKLQNALHS